MTRQDVITRLRQHEADLHGIGVAAPYLFGSVARQEQRPDSDVDLFCETDHPVERVDIQDPVTAILDIETDVMTSAYTPFGISRRGPAAGQVQPS